MGRKQWEKEKLLVTSNFSFSPAFSKDLYCRHEKNRTCLEKSERPCLRSLFLQNMAGKGENADYFPTMFSTLTKTNFNFSVAFIWLSANAFNLDRSKILSCGKELSYSAG